MSKPRTEADFSNLLDTEFTARLRELSDLKRAIRDAPVSGRSVLLKALVALAYANWEGYVKYAAGKYFDYLTLRRMSYSTISRQYYVNSFLVRLGGFTWNKPSLATRSELVREILDGTGDRFTFIHPDLINTGSNLNSSILREICIVCCINPHIFAGKEAFIDVILLKRRNSIAHGDETTISIDEIDALVDNTVDLMRTFRNELENTIYQKAYLAKT